MCIDHPSRHATLDANQACLEATECFDVQDAAEQWCAPLPAAAAEALGAGAARDAMDSGLLGQVVERCIHALLLCLCCISRYGVSAEMDGSRYRHALWHARRGW
jgi:hypothetical protein